MASYSYDETGQYFFFLITFLTFILLPWTYFALKPKALASKAKAPCTGWNTKHESVRRSRQRTIGIARSHVALALGWVAFAFVLQRALSYESATTVYDPYQILGVSPGASEREIKKLYKRLSLKFHPDKLRLADNQTKEEADSHFVELTKAYKSLTDEEIRKNYEQYGHPDGKQEFSMGIALPKWIIESQNNGYVLGVYGLLFGICLPWFVGSWWYGSRRITKDGALTTTVDAYFKEVKEDIDFEKALEIVCGSSEFSPQSPKGSVLKNIKNDKIFNTLKTKVVPAMKEHHLSTSIIDNASASKKPYAGKVAILLYAYLLRVPVDDSALLRDQMAAVEKANTLCVSLMHISLAHNWLAAYLTVLTLQQHLIQAFHPALSPLVQIPGVTPQQAIAFAAKDVKTIPAFAKMADKERKEVLKDLAPKDYDHAVKVAENWPTLEVIDARFQVVGEKAVTPGSFVQLNLKVRITPPSHAPPPALQINGKTDDLALEEAEEKDLDELIGRKKPGTSGETPDVSVHAPYFPDTRMPSWSVFVGDHKLGRVFVPPTRFKQFGYNKIRSLQLTFQAPPQPGLYTFQTYVKNDSYVGADGQKDMMMEVKQPQAVQAEEDAEDDISEPEEDTIAGQMAAMRGQPFKKIDGQEEEEYTTSDSEEEESASSSSDSDSD